MSEHTPMEIKIRDSNGISFLEVHGRLTIGEATDHFNEAVQSITGRGIRKVIVNLNGVPQIDSSGLSSLVRMSMQLKEEHGAMRLVCGSGRVRDALMVTRLIEAIPTFDSESAALANFE